MSRVSLHVTKQSVDNLLCVHYVAILTYLCHLPQSIHRGFSTDLEWALVSIFLPSSPILIKYSKSKESKTLIFPRKTHSRVLQEHVIPCRPPVPTTCAFHIHLCYLLFPFGQTGEMKKSHWRESTNRQCGVTQMEFGQWSEILIVEIDRTLFTNWSLKFQRGK